MSSISLHLFWDKNLNTFLSPAPSTNSSITEGHDEDEGKATPTADQNAQVTVDLTTKQVDVETALSFEQVQSVLKEEGYTATAI